MIKEQLVSNAVMPYQRQVDPKATYIWLTTFEKPVLASMLCNHCSPGAGKVLRCLARDPASFASEAFPGHRGERASHDRLSDVSHGQSAAHVGPALPGVQHQPGGT